MGEDNGWAVEAKDRLAFHVHAARPRSCLLYGEFRVICLLGTGLINLFQSHKDNFFDVLFESVVTPEVTMEHQYVSLLFSIDGLQHPLVGGLALQRGLDGDYLVTKLDFEPLRLTSITRA